MASSPADLHVQHFHAADGTRLAWREMGGGGAPPLVLLHGLFSDAATNWVRFGTAALLAGGRRVIMPDLRGHGLSDRPHHPAAYPPDILAVDGLALLAHLGLTDYDLGGYSLGGRTVVRMLVLGAAPRRAVVSGMGLAGILDPASRARHFRQVLDGMGRHARGSPAFMAEAFLKTTGGDPAALLPLLDSFVATTAAEIATIAAPVLVATGAEDDDNGSAEALAHALPHGRHVVVPGNHMSAVTRPELGRAMAAFLDA